MKINVRQSRFARWARPLVVACLLLPACGRTTGAASIFDDDSPAKPAKPFTPPEAERDLYRPVKTDAPAPSTDAPDFKVEPRPPGSPLFGNDNKPSPADPPPAVPTPAPAPAQSPATPAATPPADRPDPPDVPTYRKRAEKYSRIIRMSDVAACAEKLWRMSAQESDRTDRYVLMLEAAYAYLAAGDAERGLKALEITGTCYNIDTQTWKLKALARAQHDLKLPPSNCAVACTVGMHVIAQIRQTGRWDLLANLGPQVRAVANRSHDPLLQARATPWANEAEASGRLFLDAKEATPRLVRNPDDAAANSAKGKFICLVQNDWPAGLPLLAKAAEPMLKALAVREMAAQGTPAGEGGVDAKVRLSLADGWWKLADESKGRLVEPLYRSRAYHWYAAAAPALQGAEKERVGKLLAARPKPPAPAVDVDLPA